MSERLLTIHSRIVEATADLDKRHEFLQSNDNVGLKYLIEVVYAHLEKALQILPPSAEIGRTNKINVETSIKRLLNNFSSLSDAIADDALTQMQIDKEINILATRLVEFSGNVRNNIIELQAENEVEEPIETLAAKVEKPKIVLRDLKSLKQLSDALDNPEFGPKLSDLDTKLDIIVGQIGAKQFDKRPITPTQNRQRILPRQGEATEPEPRATQIADESNAATSRLVEQQLKKLPSDLKDENFRVVKGPIFVITSPPLSQRLLKQAGINARAYLSTEYNDRGFGSSTKVAPKGWILLDQNLLAVKTRFVQSGKFENEKAAYLKAIGTRLGGLMDMNEGHLFSYAGHPKVSFCWLLNTEQYHRLGAFVIESIGIPAPHVAKTPNVEQLKSDREEVEQATLGLRQQRDKLDKMEKAARQELRLMKGDIDAEKGELDVLQQTANSTGDPRKRASLMATIANRSAALGVKQGKYEAKYREIVTPIVQLKNEYIKDIDAAMERKRQENLKRRKK